MNRPTEPEGAPVEVQSAGPKDVPEELAEEFAAWGRASDRALALVEEQGVSPI